MGPLLIILAMAILVVLLQWELTAASRRWRGRRPDPSAGWQGARGLSRIRNPAAKP